MSSLEAKRTLIFAVLKFLKSELNQESIGADVKESLEVASQCLESCYEISIDDEICKNNFDSGIDLLGIAEKSIIKKEIDPKLKEEANNYKNEGNELMKQEKFNDALVCYNKAIEIDKNNAVFYCNRAAAYSKLLDYTNSIEDCKNALKIDPTYSKAWGRLGLALLSNNQIEEAYEAYNKAVQLEPANDGYKQNLKVVEEKLKNLSTGGAGGAAGGEFPFGNMGNLMGMLNNPQLINMATQLMSDPQMQNLMSNIIGGMSGSSMPTSTTNSQSAQSTATSQDSTQSTPSGQPQIPPMGGLPFGGDFGSLLQAGQRFAQQMNQMNPDLVNQLRQQMPPGGSNPPNNENPNPETH